MSALLLPTQSKLLLKRTTAIKQIKKKRERRKGMITEKLRKEGSKSEKKKK